MHVEEIETADTSKQAYSSASFSKTYVKDPQECSNKTSSNSSWLGAAVVNVDFSLSRDSEVVTSSKEMSFPPPV